MQVGDSIIAKIDTPAQIGTNWDTLNNNISYAPEDVANKVTSLSSSSTNIEYPSAKLVYDQLALKEPLLPVTPASPDTKFLNGNRLWNTIASSDLTDNANLIKGATIYGGTISDDFDVILKDGFYSGYGTATGAPNTLSSWFLLHENSNTGTISAKQTATAYSSNEILIYVRVKMSSTWGS